MKQTHRLIRCVLFDSRIDIPWPRDKNAPPEPIELCNVEVTRDGFKLFLPLRVGACTVPTLFFEVADQGELWHECWDSQFQYPPDAKLTGVIGLHALYLLRLYEIGADNGATVAWHAALEDGRVGWGAIENLRPDLLTVQLLSQWKDQRENEGSAKNSRGRPYGAGVGDRDQFALDLIAISEKANADRVDRPITWKRAVEIAYERFPDLLAGADASSPRDIRDAALERMTYRLQKRQTTQARLREIRERKGMPPADRPKK